jgi:hypothetical protein
MFVIWQVIYRGMKLNLVIARIKFEQVDTLLITNNSVLKNH